MEPTEFNEKSLEALIEKCLLEKSGYSKIQSCDYDTDFCINRKDFLDFIQSTQPKVWEHIEKVGEEKVLQRLNSQIKSKGIIEILRKGFKDQQHTIKVYNKMPASKLNPEAVEAYKVNKFSVCRQLYYSGENQNSLDMVLFLNGLPIITMELKNKQTGQTCKHAIEQYKSDRDPREPLFYFGRCIVHFALDQDEVYMTTRLSGDKTFFLPFNKGHRKGKGNPPNSRGERTAYLWKNIFSKANLSLIIERFARKIAEIDEDTKEKKHKQIFPRYHQFDVVTKLLKDAKEKGTGERYLIQHSAGSGKSNSITWLAHQLSNLHHDNDINVFDTVIVVTDRRVLDKQIRDNIIMFSSGMKATVKAVTKGAYELRAALQDGIKIITTTVQKFPYIVDSIEQLNGKKFAIIIDEAHSSQSGKSSAKMNASLASFDDEEEGEKTTEDKLNEIIEKKKLLKNASYFAFTATPKNKTLELFGYASHDGKFYPFHLYSMKQAIEEGFILDVLKNYTTYSSYYKINKTADENPKVEEKKANQKMKAYVEGHSYPISKKAREILYHFHHNVQFRIKRKAKAMIVCQSIAKAIEYYHTVKDELKSLNSPFKAIVAFSGTKKINGVECSEESLNGFPSGDIVNKFKMNEYRFLIVANKFQTGFDQPLLHTMYVDKKLGGVQAVQTLSRLNRCAPDKKDTFVLDFFNTTDEIKKSFQRFYTTTILSQETDPNRLNDMIDTLDGAHVYNWEDIDNFVNLYLSGADREQLEPILDNCKENLHENLSKEAHCEFFSTGVQYCRTYDFLSKILTYSEINYEKMACFLKMFLPKVKPVREEGEDDLQELLNAIELDSYKLLKSVKCNISLSNDDVEIDPDTIGTGRSPKEKIFSPLEQIVTEFNQRFGSDVEWMNDDKVKKLYFESIPNQLINDVNFQEILKNSSRQNARIASEERLEAIIQNFISDSTEAYKMFMDNKGFKRMYFDHVFSQALQNNIRTT